MSCLLLLQFLHISFFSAVARSQLSLDFCWHVICFLSGAHNPEIDSALVTVITDTLNLLL